MEKTYDPTRFERSIYEDWETNGYFTPTVNWSRRPFVIIIPPPNVTGELHLGHALTFAIEDILVRWHRMKGEPTLYLPGTDHAGIATQNVVERELLREGTNRHALGRERFVDRVWAWREQYGRRITEQVRRLGASCDWTRECFTMDPGPALAVRSTFVKLYDKGLIYRGKRIINWCPRCMTALSDLEVEHEDHEGHLWYIRYPLEPSAGETGGPRWITVATTRPETMLGDTGVAVNPNDERYRSVVGRSAMLPVIGRLLPIVADDTVEAGFGTGAVKVTPAHDPEDYERGLRHHLRPVTVMSLDGTMNEAAGPYEGKDRFEARRLLVDELERTGLLERVERHLHTVGHCQRCNTIVEPLISEQWFVKIAPLAERAIEVVTSGRIQIIPERFSKVYLNWMENIRDWCISRQLWWGHRIPVWYCDCGEVIAAIEDPTECPRCRGTGLRQDEDVLDTWFSSGLWPHSTLGWPRDTEDLRYFYPTSVMETGYDILFFWVARMIMMGLENTGEIPFRYVYLHGLVRDEKGEKMSKSKNNVIDPIVVMDAHGSDALRFTLATGSTSGNDMKLSIQRVEAGRNFANKLWNAARYVIGLRQEGDAAPIVAPEPRSLEDRWLLSRLVAVVADVERLLGDWQLGEAGRTIYEFLWGEYCDWYIELSKVRLREDAEDRTPIAILVYGLEASLRLLHPFMPFVTEVIWRELTGAYGNPHRDGTRSIMVAPWPEGALATRDVDAERQMELVMDLIRGIRNARAEFRVEASQWAEVVVQGADAIALLQEQAAAIAQLARARPLKIEQTLPEAPHPAVAIVVGPVSAYLPLGGLVDIEAERRRLETERDASARDIERLAARLADERFTSRAPAEVVERERGRLTQSRERLQKLDERLEVLAS